MRRMKECFVTTNGLIKLFCLSTACISASTLTCYPQKGEIYLLLLTKPLICYIERILCWFVQILLFSWFFSNHIFKKLNPLKFGEEGPKWPVAFFAYLKH